MDNVQKPSDSDSIKIICYYVPTDPYNTQEPSSHADGTPTREGKRILQLVQEMKLQPLMYIMTMFQWCINRQMKWKTI
jgi:hypothetical protein